MSAAPDCQIHLRLDAADRDGIDRIVRTVGVFRADEIDVALEVVDARLAGDGHYLFAVAKNGAQIAGYAVWGHTPCTDAVYDLYWIAVDPTLHGQGVGRQLMAACEHDVRARGGRMVLIETEGTPPYEATRRFYLSLGYAEVARIGDFYRPGADKVVYRRSLG
jgi:ribosomal protein S18 acetylase RimI-like enzyme